MKIFIAEDGFGSWWWANEPSQLDRKEGSSFGPFRYRENCEKDVRRCYSGSGKKIEIEEVIH